MCVCVCIYIDVYIHIHRNTYTHIYMLFGLTRTPNPNPNPRVNPGYLDTPDSGRNTLLIVEVPILRWYHWVLSADGAFCGRTSVHVPKR